MPTVKTAKLGRSSMYTLIGDEELRKDIKRMSNSSWKRILRRAVRNALTPIYQQARADAPSSTIRKLIKKHVYTTKHRVVGMIRVARSSRTVTFQGRQIGFEFVANVLEFGSPTQNIRARRYMRGARERRGKEASDRLIREADKAFRDEWDKALAKGKSL
jgi:hypothetical protein